MTGKAMDMNPVFSETGLHGSLSSAESSGFLVQGSMTDPLASYRSRIADIFILNIFNRVEILNSSASKKNPYDCHGSSVYGKKGLVQIVPGPACKGMKAFCIRSLPNAAGTVPVRAYR